MASHLSWAKIYTASTGFGGPWLCTPHLPRAPLPCVPVFQPLFLSGTQASQALSCFSARCLLSTLPESPSYTVPQALLSKDTSLATLSALYQSPHLIALAIETLLCLFPLPHPKSGIETLRRQEGTPFVLCPAEQVARCLGQNRCSMGIC